MTEYVAEVRDKGEVTIPKDLRKKRIPIRVSLERLS